MKFKAVIFDLDGTLIDTLEDLAGAMNYALAQIGQPAHSLEACRRMIGNGVATFARCALAEDKQHLHFELLRLMKKRYDGTSFDKSKVYDGIDEVVNRFSADKVPMGVITNKNQDNAEEVVEHYFGSGVFDYIIGVDRDERVKPNPAGTMEMIDGLGLDVGDVFFIGDSEVDIETARNAGIKSVGVTWGFRSREELLEAGADIIIDSPEEILSICGISE